jgi:7,8-dihydroneopterin aldolase/epimerase/oxygenase
MNAPRELKTRNLRTVFVRDLTIPVSIGIHAHEKDSRQFVRINIDMVTDDGGKPLNDDFDNAVCYENAVNGIKEIISVGHINLVETLAEKIAAFCLRDSRVDHVKVRVEKPDIIEEAASVGVEIERYQTLRVTLPDEG